MKDAENILIICRIAGNSFMVSFSVFPFFPYILRFYYNNDN